MNYSGLAFLFLGFASGAFAFTPRLAFALILLFSVVPPLGLLGAFAFLLSRVRKVNLIVSRPFSKEV